MQSLKLHKGILACVLSFSSFFSSFPPFSLPFFKSSFKFFPVFNLSKKFLPGGGEMARIYIPGSIFSLLVQVASEGKVAPNYVVVDTDYTGYAIVYSCSEVWASARGTACSDVQ